MKRRSKAGVGQVKGRRPKTPEPKRRNVPKTASRPHSSFAAGKTKVARLTRELSEERRQRTATSEVLHLLSGSHGDLTRLFDAILTNATKLCQANFGTLHLYEGDAFRVVAQHNAPPAYAELRQREPLVRARLMLRMAETKQLFQIADVRAYAASNPADKDVAAFAKLSGVRTVISVPMLKNGDMVGAIATYRQEVRTFSDREIELIKDFAAQAVIAIENARLLNELRQRTDNLSHRTTDLTEALEQQTATSEVLHVISNFSGDLEPVFATILEKAVRICDATFGNIYRFDGEFFHLVATHNTPPAYAEKRRQCPYRPHPNSDIGRMVVDKTVAHIADVMAEEVYTAQLDPVAVDAVNIGRIRTILGVPLMIKGEMFGTFFLSRQEVRPFTDKQIKLVQSFAAQSVIAIENARLLNELRQSLKQQTATADVLKIISRSTFDLQSVLDTLVASVAQLCEADMVVIASPTQDRDGWRQAATYNLSPKFRELMAQKKVPSGRGSIAGRVVLEEKSVQIVDIEADPEYELKEACRIDGVNTILGVPLLREGGPIGIMVLQRRAKQPFTDKQIELAETFADQALIAIENARLFTDLRQRTTDLTEALEQQTATSNVLQVISSSPGNLEPVFETMLENAVRLCDAKFGTINRWDGEALHLVATYNVPTAFAEFRKRTPFRPGPENPISQMLMTKTVIHFHNLATEQGYIDRNPTFVAAVELGGVRTFLAVPIMKENELIGVVIVYRQEVRPFSDKQIELIKSFAAQAVIAIENARLLTELRQSLEQQTATADVLKVISRSTFDLQKVLDTLVTSAAQLCRAERASITLPKGERYHRVASFGFSAEFRDFLDGHPLVIDRGNIVGRVVLESRTIQIEDVETDPEFTFKEALQIGKARTLLGVPLMRQGRPTGVLVLSRDAVEPFSDKQVELVGSFADQAVIAIENARLLKELRERTEDVQKLNQQLEARVADQVGEIERMSRLRRFLPPQVADLIVASGTEKQLESHRREITALFCDLRGFTGFSESADPEDVMTLLRGYHEALGVSINKYSGTLERYAGDGVMVVFNDPVPVENPALQAVLMALEMRDAIGALTETWRRSGHEIGFGIGISHGFATLGTIGFEGRFDYAAIGTVSNVASRLCDEAKPGQILISPRVLTKVENAVKVEPIGEFELKGIRRPLTAYNVLAATI